MTVGVAVMPRFNPSQCGLGPPRDLARNLHSCAQALHNYNLSSPPSCLVVAAKSYVLCAKKGKLTHFTPKRECTSRKSVLCYVPKHQMDGRNKTIT